MAVVTEDRALRRDRALRTAIAATVLLATVVGVVYAAAWAWRELRPASASAGPVASVPATPEEVARAYFTAVAAGDEATVRRLVAPEAAPVVVDALGADLGNVSAVEKFAAGAAVPVVPAEGATPAPGAPAETVVVHVTYAVTYLHQISGDDGPTQRWVVLARDTPQDPWLIRAMRTRP